MHVQVYFVIVYGEMEYCVRYGENAHLHFQKYIVNIAGRSAFILDSFA